MSDQRKEYGKRPASGDTGVRTHMQYDKPYGKKPYQSDKKSYGNGEREYRKSGFGKSCDGEPRKK